ncbi:MAG: hypothetical protein K1060chlam4_01481 [Candidatus Anoxychlamydiales bacterium]|nr:hypothetical protein [Candidatus Anoxychlamydiales bacterium]
MATISSLVRSDTRVSLPGDKPEIGLFSLLPKEIILNELLLGKNAVPNLDFEDLAELAKTSRFFYHLLDDKTLWEKLASRVNVHFLDAKTVGDIKNRILEIDQSQLHEINHITRLGPHLSLKTAPRIERMQEHFLAIQETKCKDFLKVWQKIVTDIGDSSLVIPVEAQFEENPNKLDDKFAKWINDNAAALSSYAVLKLQQLNLNYLPTSIGNLIRLTFLFIDDNNLQLLPKSIGKLTNLTALFAENNKFRSIPKSFDNLVNLAFIDLCNNPLLKSIPDGLLSRFPELRSNLLLDESTHSFSGSSLATTAYNATTIRVAAVAIVILAVLIRSYY